MNILKSPMLRRFLSGGILGAIRLILGLARVKFLALAIGASGLGILAQINQFQLVFIAMITLFLSLGVINRLKASEKDKNLDQAQITAGTALSTISILAFVFTLLAFTFSTEIISTIFQDKINSTQFHVLLSAILFSSLASGYIEGLLFANDHYNYYIKASASVSIIELIAYVFFVKKYAFDGVIFAILTSNFFLAVFFIFYLKKIGPLSKFFIFRFSYVELKKLLSFSFTIIATTGLGYISMLAIRTNILHSFGAEKNGILQVAVALSAYSIPFITNGLWGYFHPTVAAKSEAHHSRIELEKVLRLVLVMSACCSILLMTAPEWIIHIVYSKSFLDASKLFPVQFVADFFYFIFFTYGVYFLAISDLKTYLSAWFTYYAIQLILVFSLTNYLGLIGIPFAHFVASIISCVITYHRFSKHFLFQLSTKILFASATAALFTSAVLLYTEQNIIYRITWTILCIPFFYYFYKKVHTQHANE